MSDPDPDPPKSRLLKDLYFNRTGLLLVLTILLSVGMYAVAAHTHGIASAFWLTLATGIVATAVFTAFNVLLTTNQFNVYLRDMIERSVRRIFAAFAAEVLAAIREIRPQNSLHLPEASYPVASSPDPAFNRDLNRSFISSTSYTFQGITARYNIARFAALETRFDQVHIIVANPVELDSVVTRLMNRRFGAEAGAAGGTGPAGPRRRDQ